MIFKQHDTTFILFNNSLTIKGIPYSRRLIYVACWLIPIIAIVIFMLQSSPKENLILCIILIPVLTTFRPLIKPPPLFFDIIMSKQQDHLLVNGKKFYYEDLLFLSFKEAEGYRIIRLEAKRRNILFAHEKILITQSNSLEESLSLARQLRDFISPDLKINHVTMGESAPSVYYGYFGNRGGRNREVEMWHLID